MIRTYKIDNTVRAINVLNRVSDWNGGGTLTLDNSKKYHVEIVMNMDTKKGATYIDSALLGNTTLAQTMSNFTFSLCGYWDYFDNLVMEKWNVFPEFSLQVEEPEVGGIVVKTTSEVKNWSEFEEGIEVKRLFDGKTLTAKVEPITATEAVIRTEEEFSGGYNYEITLPETVDGLSGESFVVEDRTINAEFAKNDAAVSVRLKNYAGELLPIEDKNTTELQAISIEFTDDVSVLSAMGNVTITDAEGSRVEFSPIAEQNIGEAVFDGVLKENSEYTVEIQGFGVEYKISFATTEGSACVKSVKLYKDGNEITKLSDVNAGDTVTAKVEIANTTSEDVSYLASLTMYNGKLMTGVGFEDNSVLAASKTVSEFEMKISETSDLAFTGLMWHTEKTAPLGKSMTFELN